MTARARMAILRGQARPPATTELDLNRRRLRLGGVPLAGGVALGEGLTADLLHDAVVLLLPDEPTLDLGHRVVGIQDDDALRTSLNLVIR